MALKEYNEKRKFDKTSEPKGKVTKSEKNRFVIQHHFARKEHYDFRLEYDGVLISFAFPKGLPQEKGKRNLAVHVEDHPVSYINFQGEIPKGNYGAGTVEIFDKGTYKPINDFDKGITKGHLKFELKGKKYQGVWSLIKTDKKNWIIVKSDEVKIRRKKNPFENANVKLAKLTEKIPTKDYIYEIKYDGYRILSFVGEKIKILSRNNKDYTSKFPGIVNSLNSLKDTVVLDGEIVVFDKNGKSDFGLLTDCIKNGKNEFCYVIFDILALNDKDLRNTKLLERKEILKKVLGNCNKNLIFSNYVKTNGKKCFEFAKNKHLEGIIAKKVDSLYNDKRDDDWLKIKCYKRQEFVVGGYSKTKANKDLSAIYVGYYKDNKLIFAGKVGTGFDKKMRFELDLIFSKQITKNCPFQDLTDEAIWVKPNLVAEIQFVEITKNKLLRQPSFVALREDKNAKDVRLEYE